MSLVISSNMQWYKSKNLPRIPENSFRRLHTSVLLWYLVIAAWGFFWKSVMACIKWGSLKRFDNSSFFWTFSSRSSVTQSVQSKRAWGCEIINVLEGAILFFLMIEQNSVQHISPYLGKYPFSVLNYKHHHAHTDINKRFVLTMCPILRNMKTFGSEYVSLILQQN